MVKRPNVGFKGRKSTARRDKSRKPKSINQIERGELVSKGSSTLKDNDSVEDNLCSEKQCPSPQIFVVGDIKQRNEGIFIKGEIKDKEIAMLVDTGSSVTCNNDLRYLFIDVFCGVFFFIILPTNRILSMVSCQQKIVYNRSFRSYQLDIKTDELSMDVNVKRYMCNSNTFPFILNTSSLCI